MKDSIGIGDINTLIIEINSIFLTGKSKIGANCNVDDGITIYQSCGGDCDLTMEKNLSKVAAYSYLVGFKRGFNAPHWV